MAGKAEAVLGTDTREHLHALFMACFQMRNLTRRTPDEFRADLQTRLAVTNGASESFIDETRQRDLSIRFHWGHNHDFGSGLHLHGRMANRHIDILADFIDHYGLPRDLSGKRVLDIGVWTGGTCLLLAALGAEVTALEEVAKYAATVNFLAESFGLESQLRCYPRSLFEVLPRYADYFDYVLYSGVVYHVTDPVLSLRLIFSALRDGGRVFLETHGCDSDESICQYEGPAVVHSGSRKDLDRAGWNYFAPSPSCLQRWCRDAGFQKVDIGPYVQTRIQGMAERVCFADMCRAGLSVVHCR